MIGVLKTAFYTFLVLLFNGIGLSLFLFSFLTSGSLKADGVFYIFHTEHIFSKIMLIVITSITTALLVQQISKWVKPSMGYALRDIRKIFWRQLYFSTVACIAIWLMQIL